MSSKKLIEAITETNAKLDTLIKIQQNIYKKVNRLLSQSIKNESRLIDIEFATRGKPKPRTNGKKLGEDE